MLFIERIKFSKMDSHRKFLLNMCCRGVNNALYFSCKRRLTILKKLIPDFDSYLDTPTSLDYKKFRMYIETLSNDELQKINSV